jgi:hypothetical protein
MSEFKGPILNGVIETSSKDVTHSERRPGRRKRVLHAGLIAYAEGQFSLDCTIHDLSENGARITVSNNSEFPSHFYLINIHDRVAYEVEIIWRSGVDAGVTYEKVHRLANVVDPALLFLKRMWLARATR